MLDIKIRLCYDMQAVKRKAVKKERKKFVKNPAKKRLKKS